MRQVIYFNTLFLILSFYTFSAAHASGIDHLLGCHKHQALGKVEADYWISGLKTILLYPDSYGGRHGSPIPTDKNGLTIDTLESGEANIPKMGTTSLGLTVNVTTDLLDQLYKDAAIYDQHRKAFNFCSTVLKGCGVETDWSLLSTRQWGKFRKIAEQMQEQLGVRDIHSILLIAYRQRMIRLPNEIAKLIAGGQSDSALEELSGLFQSGKLNPYLEEISKLIFTFEEQGVHIRMVHIMDQLLRIMMKIGDANVASFSFLFLLARVNEWARMVGPDLKPFIAGHKGHKNILVKIDNVKTKWQRYLQNNVFSTDRERRSDSSIPTVLHLAEKRYRDDYDRVVSPIRSHLGLKRLYELISEVRALYYGYYKEQRLGLSDIQLDSLYETVQSSRHFSIETEPLDGFLLEVPSRLVCLHPEGALSNLGASPAGANTSVVKFTFPLDALTVNVLEARNTWIRKISQDTLHALMAVGMHRIEMIYQELRKVGFADWYELDEIKHYSPPE